MPTARARRVRSCACASRASPEPPARPKSSGPRTVRSSTTERWRRRTAARSFSRTSWTWARSSSPGSSPCCRNDRSTAVDGSEPVPLNVRIVTASRADVGRAVADSRLREDLYYLLNVVPLAVPPLRDHREDIPELVSYYIDVLVTRENLPNRRLTVGAQNRLRNHGWPGNVRELINVLQRLLILGSGSVIELEAVEAALGATPEVERRDDEIPRIRGPVQGGTGAVRTGLPGVPAAQGGRQREQGRGGGGNRTHAPLPKAAWTRNRSEVVVRALAARAATDRPRIGEPS